MIRFFIVFLCLIPMGLFAQLDDDWGDIEAVELVESTTNYSPTLSNYWDEHFYGSVSGMFSFGMNHSRRAAEVKLGYNERWNQFKVVLEGAFRQNTIYTKYETISNSTDQVIESGDVELPYQSLAFRQAYVDVYPIKGVTISAGKQTIVWGQLDIFSPVDFLLPLDINPMGFSLVKADNRMPQTTVKVSYYPLSNVEFSGYFFPTYEESALFKNIDMGDNYTEYDGVKYYTQKILPSGDQQSSSAARATWYASFMTAAVTYYNGYNNVFPVFREKYLGFNNDHQFQSEYGYYPKKGYGAEFSIPLGKMSIKCEVAVSDDFVTISHADNQQVIDALVSYNNGYNSIPVYQAFYAVGIDADFDHWFYNLYLMSIIYFKNPAMNDFWGVYESLNGAYEFSSIPVFPTLNVGRYLSEEKKGAYGIALGYFTGGLGMFLYLSNQFNESLAWGLSADFGFNFSDFSMLMNNSNDGTGVSTNYKFFEPKVTTGLGYSL